jgi:hypothetical protein
MSPTGHLPRNERVRRIGQLLGKGTTLLLRSEGTKQKPRDSGKHRSFATKPATIEQSDQLNCSETDIQILAWIERFGDSSPRDIQRALSLPKTTTFRHLNRLVSAGLLSRSGQTTAIRYGRINRVNQSNQTPKTSRRDPPPPPIEIGVKDTYRS